VSHGALDCRSRRGVTIPTEIALREGIVTRTFDANIETGPERYGSRAHKILLEPREEFVQCALAAEQQRMDVPILRRPGPANGLGGQPIALKNNDVIEVVGERPRGREPSHSSADHDGLLANPN
jgi:hypothetical protein